MKIFLVIFLLANGIYLFSQDKKEVSGFADYTKKQIKIPQPDALSFSSTSFNKVIVKDERYDTSAVYFSGTNYFVIESAADTISHYISQSLGITKKIDTGKQLIIFIKKLLITNQFQLQDSGQKRADQGSYTWLGGILYKVEIYYKIDSDYFTAFRYDTSFSYDGKNLTKDAPRLLEICLKRTVQKIRNFDEKGVSRSSKRLSLSDINAYNDKRFNLPILKDSVLKKGVYATFSDFCNNKPSYISYDIEKGKLTDELYVQDPDGKEILIRNVWGYCDGKDLFVKSAENYFKLIRYGNTFYLNGAKSIHRNKGVKVENVLAFGMVLGVAGKQNKKISYSITYQFYQLDMDSGEIF